MGANHALAGFADVDTFVAAMYTSERAQLDAFAAFIDRTRFQGKSLRQWLAARDWPAFARGYNGPAFKRKHYDTKLRSAYEKAKASLG